MRFLGLRRGTCVETTVKTGYPPSAPVSGNSAPIACRCG